MRASRPRLLTSGSIEFGLELDGEQEWLPRLRFFPYAGAVEGRWLYSSPYRTPAVGAPQLLRIDSVICDRSGGVHSVRLAWDPPHGGGSPIIGYAVSRQRPLWLEFVTEIADPNLDATPTHTSFTSVDVQQSRLYEWSVRTLTATGISDAASVRFIYRPGYGSSDGWDPAVRHDSCDERATPSRGITSPGVPQDVRADWDASAGQLHVSWTPPADDGGDRVTSYRVSFSDSRSPRPSTLVVPARLEGRHQAGLTVQGLIEGIVRRFSVAAVNSRGTGRPAHVDFAFEGAPAAPRNLRLLVFCDEAGEPDRVQFLWDQPEESDVTSYLVQARWRPTDTGARTRSLRWQPTAETSFTFDRQFDFVFGGRHDLTLMVRAHDENGPSTFAQRTVSLSRHECAP